MNKLVLGAAGALVMAIGAGAFMLSGATAPDRDREREEKPRRRRPKAIRATASFAPDHPPIAQPSGKTYPAMVRPA